MTDTSNNKSSADPIMLPSRIAEKLRDLILTGELTPGQRIPERHFSEELGVSRTPLREAIKTLAAEGLVTLQSNRGAIVSIHSIDVIKNTVELIEYLETAAGELAAKRATDEEIAEIAALHFEMKAAFLRRDRVSYNQFNRDIHAAILKATKNEVMTHAYTVANARLFSVRYAPSDDDTRWETGLNEHESMLSALQNRDSAELGKLLREHLHFCLGDV